MQSWCDRDLYDLLGVESHANESVIKKKYRQLASKWHPDKNGHRPEAQAKIQLLNYAKDILLNPEKRKKYDDKIKSENKVYNKTSSTKQPNFKAESVSKTTSSQKKQPDFKAESRPKKPSAEDKFKEASFVDKPDKASKEYLNVGKSRHKFFSDDA